MFNDEIDDIIGDNLDEEIGLPIRPKVLDPSEIVSRADAIQIAICIERVRATIDRVRPGDMTSTNIVSHHLFKIQMRLYLETTTIGNIVAIIDDLISEVHPDTFLYKQKEKLTGLRAKVVLDALFECKRKLGFDMSKSRRRRSQQTTVHL